MLNRLLFATSALLLVSCASAPSTPAPRRDRNLITAEEIAAEPATSAAELLERLRPTWLRNRGPTSIGSGAPSYPIVYIDEDKSEYRLIDYDSLYVATVPRNPDLDGCGFQKSIDGKEWIIPLNGFHLFDRVYHKPKSKFDIHITKRVNNKEAVVKYVAVNNKAYETGAEEDHVQLEPGDRVVFSVAPCVMLEDEAHCHFDSGRMYRRAQARNVDLVYRGDELILPKGRILIKKLKDWYCIRCTKTHTAIVSNGVTTLVICPYCQHMREV